MFNEKASNEQVIRDSQKELVGLSFRQVVRVLNVFQNKLRQDVDTFSAQISSSRMVDADLRRVDSELCAEEDKYQRHQAEAESANYDKALADNMKASRDLQDAREKLEHERQSLIQQADSRAKLSSRQQELKRRRDNIDAWCAA
jgi:DNA repair protein RAD50